MDPMMRQQRDHQQTSTDIKMDPKLHQQQRKEKREECEERDDSVEPKWRESIDVAQFRPQEIKVKVDPMYHTVTISAKHSSQPWPMEQRQWQKMKRVVPLPENVDVEQLRVKLSPRGELLLKAPYQRRHDANTPLQWKRSGAAPIAVSFKQLPQDAASNDASVQRFLRQLKSSAFPNSLDAQCVRDETTGQWTVLLDINTVGFRREEIRVQFEEEQRLLKIEARHEMRQVENTTTTTTMQRGISVKTLRREIALPEWMDGSAMRYRVMNNGVLRIQVPCQRGPCSMKTKSEKDMEQQMWQQVNKTPI